MLVKGSKTIIQERYKACKIYKKTAKEGKSDVIILDNKEFKKK